MRRHENSDLQALQRWLGALAIASLPSVATAGVAGRPDTAQLLAAVCVGALIVLVAVAVAQRRRNPPTTTTTSPAETRSAQPVASGATASRITELQTTLDARERELADRTRQLAGRLRELDNAGRELDSLAHSVSHDLRAPLRVVDGFATIVLEDYGDRGKPLDDLGRDHLRRIVAASQRMNSMIDMLLNLSRMTSRELASEKVDLSQIARELSDDLRDDIRAREPARSIEFVIAPGLRVDGDPTLLRLVLQNLLGNAAKFTAKSRDARVEVGCKEEGGVDRVFRARQRCRLRYALRRKNVRHVSAIAQRERIPRYRRWPRNRAEDHSATRRARMGRSHSSTDRRSWSYVLLHAVGEGNVIRGA